MSCAVAEVKRREFECHFRSVRFWSAFKRHVSPNSGRIVFLSMSGKTGMSKHGLSKTPLYSKWRSMKSRCSYSRHPAYKYYGARGIAVCREWADSFLAFRLWALDNGYKDGLTIDRIDNALGYSPDNCRWITNFAQQSNRRNNHLITMNGETKTASEWCRTFGLPIKNFFVRIAYGWTDERALTTPIDERRRAAGIMSRRRAV